MGSKVLINTTNITFVDTPLENIIGEIKVD